MEYVGVHVIVNAPEGSFDGRSLAAEDHGGTSHPGDHPPRARRIRCPVSMMRKDVKVCSTDSRTQAEGIRHDMPCSRADLKS
jgi:hypothetical protein